MSEAALHARLRPGGRWTAVLPGVYLAHNGLLTAGQREMAAVLYAGKDSIITGQTALVRCGIRIPLTDTIDVLIPHDRRRQSTEFVRTHRTKRIPAELWLSDGLRWAPVARAVADTVRDETDLRQARAVVAAAVQQGHCTTEQLAMELEQGPSRGSAALRQIIGEVADGADSTAEVDFQLLIKSSGLPEPMYNHELYAGRVFLGKPDAWWPEAGVAAEIDSREWHLSPELWQRTMSKHDRLSSHGIIVLHFTPRRIRSDGVKVVSELKSALQSGRKVMDIRAVPSR